MSDLERAAVEWVVARKGACTEGPDYRQRLNRLSDAEDALARLARNILSTSQRVDETK